MKGNKILILATLLTMVGMMMMPASAKLHVSEDVVTPDMCSGTPDAQSVAIAWANEVTGDLHLNVSVNEFAKGDCVQFHLVNADIETDGSYADHDFDFNATLDNTANGITFHQEFNRNSTVKDVMVQMPDKDVTLTLFCGVPAHRAAGMIQYIKVGAGSPMPAGSSSSSSSPFPFMAFGVFFLGIAATTVYLRKYNN